MQPKPSECVPTERWKQEQGDELNDADAGQLLEETKARASDCWQLLDNFGLELRIENWEKLIADDMEMAVVSTQLKNTRRVGDEFL